MELLRLGLVEPVATDMEIYVMDAYAISCIYATLVTVPINEELQKLVVPILHPHSYQMTLVSFLQAT